MSLFSMSSFSHSAAAPRRAASRRVSRAQSSLEALLARMRQRLYPDTLPALASFWLRTVCSQGHNKPWWLELSGAIEEAARAERLDEYRDVLLSLRDWIQRWMLGEAAAPEGRKQAGPPFRELPEEDL